MEASLIQQDEELIEIGHKLIKKRFSDMSTVACALRTTEGKVFTGVNIEQLHSSPCSMCAEYSAIGAMHEDGDAEIETVVAVDDEGIVLPPCGKCREMMRQFGGPFVILQRTKHERFKVRLGELIPFWDSSDALRERA